MTAVMRRLQDALAGVGAGALGPPANAETLCDVAAAIAPLTLPPEVEQFWRTTDGRGASYGCFPHPGAADPEFALECWREHQRQPGMTPDLLFPVCYESHAFLLVELTGADDGGGACFTWAYDGEEPFVLVASDLVAYLDVAAETLEAGHVSRHEHDGRTFPILDDHAFRAALRERLRRTPHPRYGDRAEIDWRPTAWPAHWLASVGPAALEQHARGATTTIAALSTVGSATAGRVHAVVRELWGSSEGARVRIDDGTATMIAWCPAAVTMFGPSCEGRYEFDLVTSEDALHAAAAEAIAVRALDADAQA